MECINFTIKHGMGEYSNLDKEYYTFLKKTITNVDEDKLHRWEVYNIIIDELINIGYYNIFQEIKYRVTDDENINTIILDVITNEITNISTLLYFMKKRVKKYIEQDFYNQFY
jgi:hypothetical protein